VAVVAEVDDEGALDGLHGDPGPAAVAGGLESPDEFLQQQRDGAGVGRFFYFYIFYFRFLQKYIFDLEIYRNIPSRV